MLLTITTTHTPATDLGYLLHKNPARPYSRRQSYGVAHVFYPQADAQRCTAALFVEVDPIELVRGRQGAVANAGLMDQYVNDRPYAASSLLSSAIADSFRSAMSGQCADRPALVTQPIALDIGLPVLPCKGGEALLRALFEPLGYAVQARRLPLDERFPAWGESRYFDVRLHITAPLQQVLTHLYVLIPVLDDGKHYWIGESEVDKLLSKGEQWLPAHPQRALIVNRYLRHRRGLTNLAFERLMEMDDLPAEEEIDANDDDENGATPQPDALAAPVNREQALERGLSLNDQRLQAVDETLAALGARSVIDLGCGEGRLLKRLLPQRRITRLVGMDVSHRALEIARARLKFDQLPRAMQDKLTLLHGSLVYRDARLAGHDAATVIEVIEHLDATRLEAFTRVLFEGARPQAIVMTTPNREYNARFANLPAGQWRHADHRFEWTRAEFEGWARAQGQRFGYALRFAPIGAIDPELGAPTQMAVFTLGVSPPEELQQEVA